VFYRYHKAGKTRIRRVRYNLNTRGRDLLPDGKLVQTNVGYDAASLNLWCVGEEMPCGVLSHDQCLLSLAGILLEVRNNAFFGFVQVGIHVPEQLLDHFSEMSSFFKNEKVPSGVGEYTQT